MSVLPGRSFRVPTPAGDATNALARKTRFQLKTGSEVRGMECGMNEDEPLQESQDGDMQADDNTVELFSGY
jgi:hypothetical protein